MYLLRVAYHALVDSKAVWVEICDAQPQFPEMPDPVTVKQLFNAPDGA